MGDLRCYTLHYYFRIKNSNFFNGEDGYVSLTFDEATKSLELEDDIRRGETMRADYAKAFGVDIEDVIRISRDEYKENVWEGEEA